MFDLKAVKFAWYDLWIGMYVRVVKGKHLIIHFYICPLPTLLIHIRYHRHSWNYNSDHQRVTCNLCGKHYKTRIYHG